MTWQIVWFVTFFLFRRVVDRESLISVVNNEPISQQPFTGGQLMY